MKIVLLICGLYNIGWGIFVYAYTEPFVKWITHSTVSSTYQIELHGVGLLLLSGIFILTAFYPVRFWYLIAFGFMAKAFGGIWVYFSIMHQQITERYILHLFINDYLWATLLAIITYKAFSLYKLLD